MNNLFQSSANEELMNRIDHLRTDSKPQWGQMNAAQMLDHCYAFHEIAVGKIKVKRDVLGIFIGRFVKPIFYNDKPLPREMSTIPAIVIADKRELDYEKQQLKQQLHSLITIDKAELVPHPFFGKLTVEQWGKGMYKHLDHHLKQFDV